jgi:UDP-GlcNAc:undecaprenyl-phosphate GlcNAc-1-phosphate transferase
MELNSIQFLTLFVLAVLSTGIITPVMRRVAKRFGIVDQPNQAHKTHREPIPYLGGVAIMITVSVIVLSGSLFLKMDGNTSKIVLAIMVPSVLIGLVGLADDIKNLSPISRFIAQSIAALFTSIVIISSDTVGSPTGNSYLDFAITVVWIVGITNAINFFDNHDGGASGTVAISSFMLFILTSTSGQFYIAALAIVLSGSCIGFLYWNRNPARIYMGDAGSLFLGMILATILVRFDPNPINRWAGFAIPVLLLAMPILDTSVSVLSRIQRGISPFQGGQDHLSHRLVRRGLTRRATAVTLWSGTGVFSLIALLISNASYRLEGLVLSISLAILLTIFFWFFRQNDYMEKKKNT